MDPVYMAVNFMDPKKALEKTSLGYFFPSKQFSCVQLCSVYCIHDGKRSYWHSSLLLPCIEAAFGFTAAMDVFCCRFITNARHSRAINASVATRISFTSELKYIRHTHYVFTKLFERGVSISQKFLLNLRKYSILFVPTRWLVSIVANKFRSPCNVRVSPRELRSWNVALIFVFSKNCLWRYATLFDFFLCISYWTGLDASWSRIEVGLLVVCWDLFWISKVKVSRNCPIFPQQDSNLRHPQQWL
jgi:hypothetical protein